MYRMQDVYGWKNLRHWALALHMGKVTIYDEGEETDVSDTVLENAVSLLLNDCFPISLICICTENMEKKIVLTPLWKGIFGYLNNERSINAKKKQIYFKEMSDDDQKSILNALIHTIWIRI